MREIKFRAFYRGKMYQVAEMSTYQDGACTADGFWNENFSPDSEHVKAIMQFTGLKDKDGKEIYEGDIVMDLVTGNVLPISIGECDLGKDDWDIYYRSVCVRGAYGDGSGFVAIVHEQSKSYARPSSQMRVIGNICENPEILTRTT